MSDVKILTNRFCPFDERLEGGEMSYAKMSDINNAKSKIGFAEISVKRLHIKKNE